MTSHYNSPDAAQVIMTATLKGEQNLRVSVYVLNKRGEPLMPCSPRTARLLLKSGDAKVFQRTPFTIKLQRATGEALQKVNLGVDSGYLNIGLSATTDRRELFAADVNLRDDMVKLNSERRTYRRSRRHRKIWHREPRFLNRRKPSGWFAPSIQHKLDSHVKLIERVHAILPVSNVTIEVAAFDIQKIIDPAISGIGYQNGEQKGFWNVREYVLYRDGHRCTHCNGMSKDPILEVHHKESRQTGGDRPENLRTLCKTCHAKVTTGDIKLKNKASRGFKAETFMTMVCWKLIERLQTMKCMIGHTYGYLTKLGRKQLNMPKSHINDAFVISGGTIQERSADMFGMQQVRKCNRKLFKGDHSHIRNTAPRELFGYRRYDKVDFNGAAGFIFGRRSSGYFDIRSLDGTKIHASAKHTDLVLLERASSLLIVRRIARIAA